MIPLKVELIPAIPFVGVIRDVIFSISKSASKSFVRTAMSTSCVSNGVDTESSFATGALLTPVTVSVNVSSSDRIGIPLSDTVMLMKNTPESRKVGEIVSVALPTLSS